MAKKSKTKAKAKAKKVKKAAPARKSAGVKTAAKKRVAARKPAKLRSADIGCGSPNGMGCASGCSGIGISEGAGQRRYLSWNVLQKRADYAAGQIGVAHQPVH